ncbi:MAG: hypothetical protein J6K13_08145 [Clostridia bacterium]|nr:hypothetical protein [Clostridia bacterium]
MNKKRRASIQSIHNKLDELRDQIEILQNEEQDAYNNLPESLQDSERGIQMNTAIDALEMAYGSIEEAMASLEEAIE